MLKADKVELLKNLREKISKARVLVLTDFRGLTMEQLNDLRQMLYDKNVEFRVVKNRITKRALKEEEQDTLDELLVGPTGIAFGYDDPVEPIKLLVEFRKNQEILQLKGGLMEGTKLDVAKLEQIAKLPTINEMYGRIVGSLKSPLLNVVWRLKSATGKLAWALKAVAETKQ